MAGFGHPCLGAPIVEGCDEIQRFRPAGADRALPQITAEFTCASEMAASAG
jgi:hypothetical protein